jgi:hypothetical protein
LAFTLALIPYGKCKEKLKILVVGDFGDVENDLKNASIAFDGLNKFAS